MDDKQQPAVTADKLKTEPAGSLIRENQIRENKVTEETVTAETDVTPSISKPKAFLNSINHFRGIAIIFIVMAHCYRPAGWQIETFADKAWFNLMMNGTVFFVFISGFLFHHVFY
ncbi:acyltransferase family protein, partial [Shewanella sp. 0m-11]